MRQFTFRREARWLLLLGLLPVVGIVLAIVWPMLKSWMGR
jgi:hypothetical protein